LQLGIVPTYLQQINGLTTNDYGDIMGYGCYINPSGPVYESTLGASLKAWNSTVLDFSIKNYALPTPDSWTFGPFQASYHVGLSYTWKTITIGAWHECAHPIITNPLNTSPVYLSAETEVFVRFTGIQKF
jgi:hypothetical protein